MSITVLGVDPGTRFTGFGVVRGQGQTFTLVEAGTIAPESPDVPFPQILCDLRRALADLIAKHRPAELAVEEAFVHRNARAALQTGSVRGVALLTAAEAGLPVGEYNPQEVKQSLVGRGGATKEQVAFMVRAVLGRVPAELDSHALDAVAVALCHLWRRGTRP
jgi:crossover junction endodeoxyribonuclease RuvC